MKVRIRNRRKKRERESQEPTADENRHAESRHPKN